MTINQIKNALAALGQHIAQERLKQNLTQLALATRAGVAYSTLRKIESTGQGGMAHYAAILLALGQLEQLSFSRISAQPEPKHPSRQRARAPKVATKLTLPPRQAGARLSEKLGLDFPYDWSNPAISDTALIGKVLDKARFMDVSKTFAHYGITMLNACSSFVVARTLSAFEFSLERLHLRLLFVKFQNGIFFV